ncbi:Pantothenate synthetase [Penicillium subrubescens]|uniref:Pantothenate synthetase n=1 Tax=Penicillium subrubescens TaxID=1316194 RepID=A0A1Q5UIL4_9EURO|nr:Pantothenate synthetase [Penicillium subrubescens]
MVKDFLIDTEVRIVATAREADGLALSSRNVYLGARRRIVGLTLHKALSAAAEAYKAGKTSRDDILGASRSVAERVLSEQQSLPPSERALYEVDYISLADPESLEELDLVDLKKGVVLSTAFDMAPLEETEPGEDCGLGDGKVPRRSVGLGPKKFLTSTVAPVVDYASNFWMHGFKGTAIGSINRVKRIGAQAIVGTFLTTSVAEAEAHIATAQDRFWKRAVKMWTDMHTLPETNPLRINTDRIRKFRRYHRSPLYHVADALKHIEMEPLEPINPFTFAPWEDRVRTDIHESQEL